MVCFKSTPRQRAPGGCLPSWSCCPHTTGTYYPNSHSFPQLCLPLSRPRPILCASNVLDSSLPTRAGPSGRAGGHRRPQHQLSGSEVAGGGDSWRSGSKRSGGWAEAPETRGLQQGSPDHNRVQVAGRAQEVQAGRWIPHPHLMGGPHSSPGKKSLLSPRHVLSLLCPWTPPWPLEAPLKQPWLTQPCVWPRASSSWPTL